MNIPIDNILVCAEKDKHGTLNFHFICKGKNRNYYRIEEDGFGKVEDSFIANFRGKFHKFDKFYTDEFFYNIVKMKTFVDYSGVEYFEHCKALISSANEKEFPSLKCSEVLEIKKMFDNYTKGENKIYEDLEEKENSKRNANSEMVDKIDEYANEFVK